MTAITGPNEAGKSFVVEMIRFSLFGTSALRGKADIECQMTFDIRGKSYSVERTMEKAKLRCGDELLANGVRAVNAKIQTLLGFDLGVFDVACVTNQGQVERLGDMKPTERKRMVDQVIGVDRLDELSKWCSDQGSLLGREIEVLERGLIEPVAPEKPDGYHCSSSLRIKVSTLRETKQELDQLLGWLSQVRTAPVIPVEPQLSAGDREAELQQIYDVEAKRRHLLSLLVVDFDPEEARRGWDAYDKWEIYDVWKGHNPRPRLSRRGVDEELANEARRVQHAELSAQLSRLEKSPLVTCPNCATDFHLEHTRVDHLRSALANLGPISVVSFTPAVLREEQRRLDNWGRLEVREMARTLYYEGPQPPKPGVSRAQLAAAPLGISKDDLADQLADLPVHRERAIVAAELQSEQTYLLRCQAWEAETDTYVEWQEEYMAKRLFADELTPLVAELPALEQVLQQSVVYENALATYETAHSRYIAQQAVLADKEAERDGWKLARTFLAEVRTRIKTYLVPSLSAVASHLLTQMTGGERNEIVVDEEFEITVDGQPLGTLSGSGKACANLALRIGLGQVLTHNVLSLFIGDEIDASMDSDRAENTHSSLQRLTDRISQIFLISHKSPEADFTITLGEQACDRQYTHSAGAAGEEL